MFRRLITSLALIAGLSLGAVGLSTVATTPTPAGATCVASPKCIPNYIVVTPHNEQVIMLNAYVYGLATGAFYSCSEMGYSLYSGPPFTDCYYLFNTDAGTTFNIIKFWSYYGDTVVWEFDNTIYDGYYATATS